MNTRVARPLATLSLLAASLLVTGAAGAQDTTDLVQQGVQLRREGHDVEALAVFARALAMDGTPRTRAQVALAEQALGFWLEAERDLSAALSAGEGPWFVQHREALNTALEAIRRRLATLSLEVNVEGAELWINGARAGTAPISSPIRVAAGSMVVEARAEGYAPQTHHLDIGPGTQTSDRLELIPLPVAARTVSIVPPPIPLASTPAVHPRTAARRIAAWSSLGAAVALGVGGGVAVLVRDGNAAVYDDDSRCFYGNLTRDQRCGSYRETAMVAQTLAIAQLAVAGIAIGAGTFLFLTEPKDLPPRREAACSFGIGVTCKFVF